MRRQSWMLLAALVMATATACGAVRVDVVGNAMAPTLKDGESAIATRDVAALQRGDIVGFRWPRDESKSFVQRIIGLPGDRIEAREGQVILNGSPLQEPYVAAENRSTESWGPATVAPDGRGVRSSERPRVSAHVRRTREESMTQPSTRPGRLHHELIRGMVEKCAIPSHDELQARLGCSSSEELHHALAELAELHGVVLHPASHHVWAVHPFSLAPTPFLVQSGEKKWWGNCAWCSLGIAVIVGGTCLITTTLGAESEQVQLTVENGQVNRSDLVVHFPIPMMRAWDNVVYTCSTMLLFKGENDVADWSARHRIPRGDIQPVAKVLELAKRWYGEHLLPDWTKKSVAEARAIFADLGFDHPVWSLPSGEGRF